MNKNKNQDNQLEGYERYNEIDICSNRMINMNIFKYDYIFPLLIGKGERPLIWLSIRKPETFTWVYIIYKNISYSDDIKIDTSIELTTVIKDIEDKKLIEVIQVSESKVSINAIDLRPFGYNVFCENEKLTIGQYNFSRNTVESSDINFQTTLEDLYKTILNRFPAGREAAYLLNNKPPDPEIVKDNLKTISLGGDSDQRYRDEYSKIDALNFIKTLEFILRNPLKSNL